MAQVTAMNALQYTIDEAMAVLNNYDCSKSKVIWFGQTHCIDIIQNVLISKGKRIHYVIDNDSEKWGSVVLDDLIVFPVEMIVNNYKNDAIFLIASNFTQEMQNQLLSLGVSISQIKILSSPYEQKIKVREQLLKQTVGFRRLELRETQLILLDILKVFRDYCNSNGLLYFLSGGTLLGAVRHKGFIA